MHGNSKVQSWLAGNPCINVDTPNTISEYMMNYLIYVDRRKNYSKDQPGLVAPA